MYVIHNGNIKSAETSEYLREAWVFYDGHSPPLRMYLKAPCNLLTHGNLHFQSKGAAGALR